MISNITILWVLFGNEEKILDKQINVSYILTSTEYKKGGIQDVAITERLS